MFSAQVWTAVWVSLCLVIHWISCLLLLWEWMQKIIPILKVTNCSYIIVIKCQVKFRSLMLKIDMKPFSSDYISALLKTEICFMQKFIPNKVKKLYKCMCNLFSNWNISSCGTEYYNLQSFQIFIFKIAHLPQ
jgi:hypothetical protein